MSELSTWVIWLKDNIILYKIVSNIKLLSVTQSMWILFDLLNNL